MNGITYFIFVESVNTFDKRLSAEINDNSTYKFKIAAKEADEAEYWLLLAQHSKHYPETTSLLNQLTEIQKIINKIISTSKKLY
ncbi:MAG: four helix bundle protein [Bacteroidetes bacterium]|nr:four helix bundle protein [Bacteroidota bacterium]